MTLPWYKRYPRDAVFDHVGLGPDLIGALNTIVDLIYAAGEPIQNDPRWLGRLLGCPTKRARSLTDQLVDRGKLIIVEGNKLSNLRAETELAMRRKENASKVLGGHKGGTKSAENRQRIRQESPEKTGDLSRIFDADGREINSLDQAELKHARARESDSDSDNKISLSEYAAARGRRDQDVSVVGQPPLLLPIDGGRQTDDHIVEIENGLRLALEESAYASTIDRIDDQLWRQALEAEAREVGAGARHIINRLFGRREAQPVRSRT